MFSMKQAFADLMVNAVVLLAYVLAAKVGLQFAFVHNSVSPVWPATGVALAAIILMGRRVWPAVILGAFIVNLDITHPSASWAQKWGSSAAIALGNWLEAAIGAALVHQFAGGRNFFKSAANIFRFVLYAAMLSTALSSTIGVTSLCLSKLAAWDNYGPVWWTWWMGDTVGALVVAPLVVVWATMGRPRFVFAAEATALMLGIVATSLIAFGPTAPARAPMGYLTIPPLLWAAMRFHQRGVTTGWFIVSAVAVWGTINERGVFAFTNANTSLLFLQVYLGTISVTFLVLAAVVAERSEVEARREESERHAREMAEREQSARREAELANKAKDNFLAVLSHELRTPLTPVLLTASFLERHEGVSEEIKSELKIIRQNVELEARLIDDLLDLTRIARGKLQLNMETTDLHAVVNSAIAICAGNGNTPVVAELRATQHTVRGDSARMQQVFWNLLTNAQKFTPASGTIRVRSFNPQVGTVCVEVSDSGIGIEPDLLPKLFNAFEQGDGMTARKAGGLGLGLAISKALVGAHGGNLLAHSAGKGKGATFAVQISTVAPVTELAQKPRGEKPTMMGRSLNVLLVEDDEMTQRVMSLLLRQMGHQTSAAGDIKSALGFAEQSRYDLIISDLGLPDGSGHELMREIQKRYGIRGIALSGFGMEEDVRKSHEAGFAEHLIKPVTIEKLEAVIAKITA